MKDCKIYGNGPIVGNKKFVGFSKALHAHLIRLRVRGLVVDFPLVLPKHIRVAFADRGHEGDPSVELDPGQTLNWSAFQVGEIRCS